MTESNMGLKRLIGLTIQGYGPLLQVNQAKKQNKADTLHCFLAEDAPLRAFETQLTFLSIHLGGSNILEKGKRPANGQI